MRTRKQQLDEQTSFHEADIRATRAIILDCERAKDDISETIKTYRAGLDLMEAQLLKRIQAIKEKCAERLISLEGREDHQSEEADTKKRKTLTVVEQPQQATV